MVENQNINSLNSNSREVNSIRNVIVDVIYLLVTFAGNFIVKRAIIQMLGFEYYGVQGLYSNIFMLITFAEAGIATAMTYSLYKPIAQKDFNKIDALYYFFRKVYRYLALFTLVLGLLGLLFIKQITYTDLPYDKLRTFYIIYMLQAIVNSLFGYVPYVLVADQKRYVSTICTLVGDALSLGIGAYVLYRGYGFGLFLAIVVFKNLFVGLFMKSRVKKNYPFIKHKNLIEKNEQKLILHNVRDLFVYNLSESILSTTDSIFISVLLGTVYVGLYSSYQWIVKAISNIVFYIFKAISASVGNLLLDKNSNNKYRIFMTTQIINIWLCGATTVCFFYLVQDFILLWIGPDTTLPMPTVWLITISMYFTSIRQSILVFREAAGLFYKARKAVVTKAILNVALSLIFGMLWGVFGIVLATLVSTLATTYWYESYILNKTYFNVSMKKDVMMQAEGIVLFAVCLLISGFVADLFPVSGWGSILIKAVVLAVFTNIYYIGVLSFHKQASGDILSIIKNFLIYAKNRVTK